MVAMLCFTMLAVQYNASCVILYYANYTMLCYTVLYYTVVYIATSFYVGMLCYRMQSDMTLHYTTLCYNELYYTIYYTTILHYIIL